MSMTFLSPSQTVQLFLKAMETLNYREAVKYIADDCEYAKEPSISTTENTRPSNRKPASKTATTLANDVKIMRQSQNASIVYVERFDHHQVADKWVELPVTGVFEVHEGLIIFWRDFVDTTTFTTQWPPSKEA
jgi:limonene-1,2-epoxide hydrolase